MNAVETAEWRIQAVLQGVKEAGVMVKNESEISAYLARHEQIREVTQPLAEALAKTFGEDQIRLCYWRSREDGDDHFPEFVVRQHDYSEDFMERIWKFRRDNESLLSFSEGWISVVTDFASPNE